MKLPPRPIIYEINTWVWLDELSRRLAQNITLANVPSAEWDALAGLGFDAVWLMGVWERSPAGLAIARDNPDLMDEFAAALPDLAPDDIVGSPYAIRRYTVDARLGGRTGLAAARSALAQRGLALILDFVPNHVAPDHPWLDTHPDYFIQGTAADLAQSPDDYYRSGDVIVARGRDPYFPPWPDVVQLNAFDAGHRTAAIATLKEIADQCDGVRCDMAMLMTNEVFGRTWGDRAGPPPAGEYWPEIIPAVRMYNPDFCFLAEVYWDMEAEMLAQGFDYCYDKRLYDQLKEGDAGLVGDNLTADPTYQDHLLRFIENHDETRAAVAFPRLQQQAAAVVSYTLPGAKLLHEGQLDGRRVKLPVFLARRPEEAADVSLQTFYHRLLAAMKLPALREGVWDLCAITGWPDNNSARHLVSWQWQAEGSSCLVVVNLSPRPSQGQIRCPWPEIEGEIYTLKELFTGDVFDRHGDELLNQGLFVDLPAWGYHLLLFD